MRLKKDIFQGTCCKHCRNGVVLLDFSDEGVTKRRKICAACEDRPPLETAFADLIACYIYADTRGKDTEFKEQESKVRRMVKQGYGINAISKETGISFAKIRRAIDLYGLRNVGEENVGRHNKKKHDPQRHKKEQAEPADDKGTD